MLNRLINGLLNLCCWLERLRNEGETPTMQPYEPVVSSPEMPADKQDPPADQPVYLRRPANSPVLCHCVERHRGYMTTRPGCKRCHGVGTLAQ